MLLAYFFTINNYPLSIIHYPLSEAHWRSEGQCTCGGTLTKKYEYIADRSIKLRIKPNKGRFNLYCRRWNEWDRPLDQLQAILADHGLL
jgi:hypothetical protein